MAEEFSKIIEKSNTGNIKDKIESIVESISTITNIFVDAMEQFDKRIIILEGKVNSISVQHIEDLPEPIATTPKRRDLPTIPSNIDNPRKPQVSGKELGNSVGKDIGRQSIRGAILGELKSMFELRRKKLENKTN